MSQEYKRRASFSNAATSTETLSQRLTSPLAQYSAFAKRTGRLGSYIVDHGVGRLNSSKAIAMDEAPRIDKNNPCELEHRDEARNTELPIRRKGERQSVELGSTSRERRKRLYRISRESLEEERQRNGDYRSDFDDEADILEIGSMQDVSCALRVESLLDTEALSIERGKEGNKLSSSTVCLRGKVKLREKLKIRRTRWMELDGYQLSCHGKSGGKSRWVKDIRNAGVWYNIDYQKVVIVCKDGSKMVFYTTSKSACTKWVTALQQIRKQRRERVTWVDDLSSSITISDGRPPSYGSA